MKRHTALALMLPALVWACDSPRSERMTAGTMAGAAQASVGIVPGFAVQDDAVFPAGRSGVDLVVASVGIPENVVVAGSSDPAMITVIIENIGAEALNPALLGRDGDGTPVVSFRLTRAFLDGAEVPAGFARWSVPVNEALGPEDMLVYRIPVGDDPRWLPTGDGDARWAIQVEVDPLDRVPEWDEGNNRSRFLEFTVTAGAGSKTPRTLVLR